VKIDIRLHKSNRKLIKRLVSRLLGDYKYVKIEKKTVTIKRRWYSLKKRKVQVVDLVLLHIPYAINELYEENGLDPIFESNEDLGRAVEYFGTKEINDDFIQFLQYQIDNLDMSVSLIQNYDSEPILLKEQEEPEEVKETYTTKRLFIDAIEHFHFIITDIINEVQPKLKVVYINTESACNSPPIRAPGFKVA
jgi:hypothetical protein